MLGGRVELRSDPGIRPIRGKGKVPRALLRVNDHPGERAVHGLAAPHRSRLVAHRAKQRMTEAHTGALEDNHALASRELERRQHLLALAIRSRDHVRGRPTRQSSDEQDLTRLPGQPLEPLPEHSAQAVWNGQRRL